MADRSRSPFGDTEPLFYDVSPRTTWVVRGVGVLTLIMVVLAFIFCIVQAEKHSHPFFYLLACNTVMSFLVGAVNAWWYRQGHLTGNKYWYLFIVAAVIIWQCIATDIFVFHPPGADTGPETTAATTAPTTSFTATTSHPTTTTAMNGSLTNVSATAV